MIPGVGLITHFIGARSRRSIIITGRMVAAATDCVRMVGRQKPGMVQAFLGRILPRGGDHCAVFYLVAAPAAAHRCWLDRFFANRDCCHRQLLLLQPDHDRVVFIVD